MILEAVSNCPICGSASITVIEPEYNLCSCVCGFVFDNPRPTLQSISDFYSAKGKYKSWEAIEEPYRRLWKRRLKILLRHSAKGNLLDIGAGIGQFLSLAKPYFSAVSGTEVSTSGSAVAAQKYGVELIIGDIHSLSLSLDSYDNITLFHVLEHVHDPLAMLNKCFALLRQNGTLLVCVPNDVLDWKSSWKAWGKRLRLPRFEKFSRKSGLVLAGTSSEIHLSHFTPASLSMALEKSGLTIEKISLDPYYPATWIETMMQTPYYLFHRALLKITGINRYSTILAVAKKR
jgi:2-polyprenyl-3-methyl-5-hydroxy-6-metoxy-1,4-benzoquinol methylase